MHSPWQAGSETLGFSNAQRLSGVLRYPVVMTQLDDPDIPTLISFAHTVNLAPLRIAKSGCIKLHCRFFVTGFFNGLSVIAGTVADDVVWLVPPPRLDKTAATNDGTME